MMQCNDLTSATNRAFSAAAAAAAAAVEIFHAEM